MTSNTKNVAIFFSVFICIIIFHVFIMGAADVLFFQKISDAVDTTTVVADGFTIEKYNVILDVNEDNIVDVTEQITVNWTDEYHHGIRKFTPEWLKYTNKLGKTIKRKSIVKDYEAIGDPYTIDTVKKKPRITIGSPYEYVPLGEKTYQIKYQYDMGKDPFKNFDEFIFHAYGDYWGTEIKNASIQVIMPKSINEKQINFFTDKYRENNVNNIVDYIIEDNKLTAKFNREEDYKQQKSQYCDKKENLNQDGTCDETSFNYRPLKTALTVDIELPEGYFSGGSWNYGYNSLIISIIIILLTLWTIIKWIKYGKNYDKVAKTVEFYPPENLNAAEIGYIYNSKEANNKLTIALIIQLASKGYIKIDDVSNTVITITNLAVKPKELKSFESTLPVREIEIKKTHDIDTYLQEEESKLMKEWFKDKDIKVLRDKTKIEDFLRVKDNLIENKYIEIIRDNEESRYKNIDKKKEEYEQELKKYEEEKKKYDEKIAQLPELSGMEKIVYNNLFNSKEEIVLSEHKTFYKTFTEIANALNSQTNKKVYDEKSYKQIIGAFFRIIIIAILSYVSYSIIEDLDPKWSILYYLSFSCIAISIFFTIIMGRKTKYGEQISARVLGFRDFLLKVEKENLEALVEKDPKYFYNILPYTYVLGISKKWVKKFENIPMPEVEMGDFDYTSVDTINSLYNNVYYPVSSSSSSSGGCSSCGGGCSSCGGGCSSCGGGSSW